MAKVFTSQQFVDKFKWLVNDVPNEYYSGSQWLTFDKSTGKWRMDCVLSVKGILWGFNADKNKSRGGAVYKSNGVPDFTCNGALDYCTGVSKDFSKTIAGEYVCMKGTKYNHTGVILKPATPSQMGDMFECTSCSAWGVKKCVISQFDIKGNRYYKGKRCLTWTYHAKLNYIDYNITPPTPPTPTPSENYVEIDTTSGVWCRTGGFGFKYPKYKVIPYKTKCQLLDKNVGNANGYSWDKILYDGKTVYIPNKWCKYISEKTYIQLTEDVWCRTGGFGFKYPKYKIIPKNTKCELIARNVGSANGYSWDKVIYDNKTVYLPNKWTKYL